MDNTIEIADHSICDCDLCGDSSQKEIRRTDEYLHLCPCCSKDADGWEEEKKIGESLLRFMIGNVI